MYFLRGFGISTMVIAPALYISGGPTWYVALYGALGAAALYFGFRVKA